MMIRKNSPWIIAPNSDLIIGGIISWTKNLMSYSEIEGHQQLYQIYHYSNHLRASTNLNIIARLYSGLVVFSQSLYKILVIIVKHKPSVLHVTSHAEISLIKDYLIIMLAKINRTPVVLHWHFGRIPKLAKQNNWEWKLLAKVVRASSYSIVIDQKSYDALKEKGFTNVANVPNPIPLDIEKIAVEQLSNQNKLPIGRMLFVGYVVNTKGVYELVEACVSIPEVNELVLIGPYEEQTKQELLEIANARGNGNWLKLLGQLNKEQVLEYMAKSRILTLPSYTEGFPNVVIEGMAMGCAVVATDVGAIPQMIDFGGEKPCGVCVAPQNVEELKVALSDLVSNTEKAAVMGRRGIEKVLNNYTLDKVVDQYISVWNAAITNGL